MGCSSRKGMFRCCTWGSRCVGPIGWEEDECVTQMGHCI